MNTDLCLSDRTHKAYIAHPLRGENPHDLCEIYDNINAVDAICRRIVETEPGVLPLSPIHAFGFYPPVGDQSRAFDLCRALLITCDELRVYGDYRSSEGCQMEIELARHMSMPIVFEDGPIEGGSSNGE